MNRAEEDYLKSIYELSLDNSNNEFVEIKSIALELNHSVQTVNEMIRKLSRNGFLQYVRYKGVKLTNQGILVSTKLVKIHRIWETFLVDKLGYSWEEVHHEAHALEHATSPLLTERMYEFLGKPKYCPHGNPISNLENNVDDEETLSLLDGKINTVYVIKKVKDENELLDFLNKNNIQLGKNILINKIDSFNELIMVNFEGTKVVFSFKQAKKININNI